MMEPLTLSEAQGHWNKGEHDDCWYVTDRHGEKIWQFPQGFDEVKVMSAIRLGREFELKAFNIGIDFGKSEAARIGSIKVAALEGKVRSLEAMNIELSNLLERNHGEG